MGFNSPFSFWVWSFCALDFLAPFEEVAAACAAVMSARRSVLETVRPDIWFPKGASRSTVTCIPVYISGVLVELSRYFIFTG